MKRGTTSEAGGYAGRGSSRGNAVAPPVRGEVFMAPRLAAGRELAAGAAGAPPIFFTARR